MSEKTPEQKYLTDLIFAETWFRSKLIADESRFIIYRTRWFKHIYWFTNTNVDHSHVDFCIQGSASLHGKHNLSILQQIINTGEKVVGFKGKCKSDVIIGCECCCVNCWRTLSSLLTQKVVISKINAAQILLLPPC